VFVRGEKRQNSILLQKWLVASEQAFFAGWNKWHAIRVQELLSRTIRDGASAWLLPSRVAVRSALRQTRERRSMPRWSPQYGARKRDACTLCLHACLDHVSNCLRVSPARHDAHSGVPSRGDEQRSTARGSEDGRETAARWPRAAIESCRLRFDEGEGVSMSACFRDLARCERGGCITRQHPVMREMSTLSIEETSQKGICACDHLVRSGSACGGKISFKGCKRSKVK